MTTTTSTSSSSSSSSSSTALLPPIAALPNLTTPQLTSILDLLFEHSVPLHTLSLPLLQDQSLPSYASLIQLITQHLRRLLSSASPSDAETLDAILCAHPRLGEKRQDSLSAASRAEQTQLNTTATAAASATATKDEGTATANASKGAVGGEGMSEKEQEEQTKKLRQLNEEYERTFPGLRYVVFVNGRSRPVIMEDMRVRIDRGDIKLEREEAIKAMCEIAMDRAGKFQQ